MKKSRLITCVLIVAVLIGLVSLGATASKTSYELSDGAVVFNSAATVNYFTGANRVSVNYDTSKNAAKFTVTGDASDPRALLSYNNIGATGLSADTYKYLVVTYMVPSTVSSAAAKTEIFYCAGSVTAANQNYATNYTFTKDGVFHSKIIDMSSLAGWSGNINALRFDMFMSASAGDVFYLDSVVFAKNSTDANEIATYRTNKANGVENDSLYTVEITNSNYSDVITTANNVAHLNGDVNCDAAVNQQDVYAFRQYLACIASANRYADYLDINNDGNGGLKDLLCLKKGLAGLYDLGNPDTLDSASVMWDSTEGAAKLTAVSANPFVNINFDDSGLYAGQYRYAVIVYKVANGTYTSTVNGVTSINELTDAHSFNVVANGTYQYAVVDLSADSLWKGVAEGFKFSFFNSCSSGAAMYVKSVSLSETASMASATGTRLAAIANGLTPVTEYKLDISGQTLGMINTPDTYQNIGPNGSQPFTTSWPAAGYADDGSRDTLLCFVSYNNYIKVADCVDLSKYSSMTITYVTDNSYKAYTSEFGFFSEPHVFGQGTDKHTSYLVASAATDTPVPSGKTNWHNDRSETVPVNSDYCGPLYMSFYMATGDGAIVKDITFTLKESTFENTDTVNNSKGDTVYTVNAEGTEIVANGVTYPNKINYTSGVTVGTDDVDRALSTSESANVGTYDFANKNVGVFYFLWLGAHNTYLNDIQKNCETYGAVGVSRTDVWDSPSKHIHYYFSEPLFGYYQSGDTWVIRKHIEELTNADVDFIFFDVTNGVAYIDSARKVMQIIHEYNEMGYNPPKVVFYSNDSRTDYTNNKTMMQYLYDTIYAANYLPDTWFYYQGKPVIIGKQTEYNAMNSTARNFFTFRQSQWPNENPSTWSSYPGYTSGGYYKKDNAWSWMDFTDLPSANRDSNGNYEAINVSIAQHLGTVAFGDSGIYNVNNHANGTKIFGTRLNHGRNWNGTDNLDNDGTTGYVVTENVKYGWNFQRQWNVVHDTFNDELPIIMVTGWNEWAAGIQNTGSDARSTTYDMAFFVDTATVNYSRDAEMTKGYYFDSYYMQLIDNIRRYKGASPTLVQNTLKRIDVNGSFDQWNDITMSFRDSTGDTVNRNAAGFGGITYTDTTGRNDLKAAKIVYDTEYIYFYVECDSDITSYNTSSTWMQLFIDIDNEKSSGWYGYDYIVNYKAQSSSLTSIATLADGDTFSATTTHNDVAYAINGKMMMIKVPLSYLGINDYTNISFAFKWADGTKNMTTMDQMYTEGDTMPHGRLNYVFTNN